MIAIHEERFWWIGNHIHIGWAKENIIDNDNVSNIVAGGDRCLMVESAPKSLELQVAEP